MPSVSASWLAAKAPSSVVSSRTHVVERPGRDLEEPRVAGERPGVQVDPRELGVVVEHLLEVRDQPVRVGRVAMEAAAQLVAQAAVGHRLERASCEEERPRISGREVVAEQEFDGHRLRELRGAAPAAVRPVEGGLDGARSGRQQLRRRVVAARLEAGLVDEPLHEPAAGRLDLGALLAPRAVDALEHLAERGHPVTRLVRVVGPAVERPPVGCQEHRHRPATAAGHRLDRGHVDLVEIGTLLAIDLDRHEPVVQVAGGRLVLERLAFHHVAPVTGRVADPQEDRPVEELRPGERVGSPREPVDRVVRVLEQVRAGLSGEAIGHGPDGTRTSMVHGGTESDPDASR